MNELSPIVSEFDSEEAAEVYDLWLRAKIATSLADGCPTVAHDEAMTRMRTIIEGRRLAAKDA